MSLKALWEIFRGVDIAKLSIDLVACLARDKAAIRENKKAYEAWQRET
jgi:hypothetical protein